MDFTPPFWLKNKHIQTVLASKGPYLKNMLPAKSVRIPVDAQVSLQGVLYEQSPKKISIVFHGLGGDCLSRYVQRTALSLLQAGESVLCQNMRGAEIEAPFVPALYHAGLTEDVSRVVEFARSLNFETISLVGFSLSSNVILKFLSEKKQNIEKAFVVSPPVNLMKGAKLIDHKKNWMYQKYFLLKLKKIIKHKAKLFPEKFSKYLTPKAFDSLVGFDEHVTSKEFGFGNAQNYYEACSSFRELKKIQNPTVIVHAKDDPFLPYDDLEAFSKQNHPFVKVKLFDHGGHTGFYEGGVRFGYERWVLAQRGGF